MSAGYASRLSEYPNKGKVGLPEFNETSRALKHKLAKLTEMVKEAKHVVVLTGAGISTSAGIPDFRGPKGVWTLEAKQKQKKGKKRKRNKDDADGDKNTSTTNASPSSSSSQSPPDSMDFTKAQPTLTHRAITKLVEVGKVKYCVTQNVDGLHRRSGLSRQNFCAIHGCAFTEQCLNCGMEYFRDEDIGGMSFQPTGRLCTECCDNTTGKGGVLVDTLLDWEDGLPEDDFERAEDECDKADLVLALGTSLRIVPASDLPLRANQFVIVNYQKTAKDDEASLIIHRSVDDVMDHLLKELGYDGWKDEALPPIQRQWKCKPRQTDDDKDDEDEENQKHHHTQEELAMHPRKKEDCDDDNGDDEKKEDYATTSGNENEEGA